MNFTLVWAHKAQTIFEELQAAAERAQVSRAKSGKKKSSRQEGLFKQVAKAVQLLASDPTHPSLKTHEYDSIPYPFEGKGKVFEAYAQNKTPGAYRIFWCYGPKQGQIYIIAITPHP